MHRSLELRGPEIRVYPFFVLLSCFPRILAQAQSNAGPLPTSGASNGSPRIEIGVPLVDPKFSIKATANEAVRQKDGGYEVITFRGNVSLKQGPFTPRPQMKRRYGSIRRSLTQFFKTTRVSTLSRLAARAR